MNSDPDSFFRDKVVYIVSPQAWSFLQISKHHYARECAARGAIVYFINPPDSAVKSGINISVVEDETKLFVVTVREWIPNFIRFHIKWLFRWLVRRQIKLLERQTGTPDVVWSFDTGFYPDMYVFAARFRIHHTVDPVNSPEQARKSLGADLVYGVSIPVLAQYQKLGIPCRVIRHGISPCFVHLPTENRWYPHTGPRKVGYAGNLVIPELNREFLLTVTKACPEVEFHFWGNTVADFGDREAVGFIEELNSRENTKIHGKVTPELLAQAYRLMDAFLVCYRPTRNYDCSDSHKILEYLASGRVVISSPISAYETKGKLVVMSKSDQSTDLMKSFVEVMENLVECNSLELQEERRQYASENTYFRHVQSIASDLLCLS